MFLMYIKKSIEGIGYGCYENNKEKYIMCMIKA